MAIYKAVNLERYAILRGEEMSIAAGFVMVVGSSVLVVDGYIWLNGLIRI